MDEQMKVVAVDGMSGRALDYAVAQATGRNIIAVKHWSDKENYRPSTNWCQCGPLIARHRIRLMPPYPGVSKHSDLDVQWMARAEHSDDHIYGETPEIAICRAIVSAAFGDVYGIPVQLLEVSNG